MLFVVTQIKECPRALIIEALKESGVTPLYHKDRETIFDAATFKQAAKAVDLVKRCCNEKGFKLAPVRELA